MRILLVKTSAMGDVIHAFAALNDALSAIAGLEIDWLVEESFADMARLHPGVRQVITTALRRWRKKPFSPKVWGEVRALRRRLKERRYDLVVDAQGLIKSALLARLAGAPVHGFDGPSARESLAARLEDVGHFVPHGPHAVDRYRILMGKALGYEPDLSSLEMGLARPYRGGREVFLLHGTTWFSKIWPPEYWIALAKGLVELGLTPLITGGSAQEFAFAQDLVAKVPGAMLVERKPLKALAEQLAECAAAVGGDTGLIHLSAAYGVPTYALFSASKPDYAGPKGRHVRIIASTAECAPCGQRVCARGFTTLPLPCHESMGAGRVLASIRADLNAGVFQPAS